MTDMDILNGLQLMHSYRAGLSAMLNFLFFHDIHTVKRREFTLNKVFFSHDGNFVVGRGLFVP